MRKQATGCLKCGCATFYGNQEVYAEVVVDSVGDFIRNNSDDGKVNATDSSQPYGKFVCTQCGAEYEDLPLSYEVKDVDPNTEKIAEILAIMESHDHDIDDIVADLCSHEATSINNQGPEAQARYILESYGNDIAAIRAQF